MIILLYIKLRIFLFDYDENGAQTQKGAGKESIHYECFP